MPGKAIRFLIYSSRTVFFQYRMLPAKQPPVLFRELIDDRASLNVTRLMIEQIPPMRNGKTLPTRAAGLQLATGSQHKQPVVQREAIPVLDTNRRFGRTGQKAGQYRRMYRIRTMEYQTRLNRKQALPLVYGKTFPALAVSCKL